MSHNEGGADPLLRAIGEFRQEMLAWIDHRLDGLRAQDSRSEEIAGAVSRPGVEPLESGQDPGVPSKPGGARASTPATGPSPEPAEPTAAGDARLRLDALARQLGERMKTAEKPRKGTEAGPAVATEGTEKIV